MYLLTMTLPFCPLIFFLVVLPAVLFYLFPTTFYGKFSVAAIIVTHYVSFFWWLPQNLCISHLPLAAFLRQPEEPGALPLRCFLSYRSRSSCVFILLIVLNFLTTFSMIHFGPFLLLVPKHLSMMVFLLNESTVSWTISVHGECS